jgi:uncharacterized protein YqjF (DUF2071 family)
VTVTLDHSKLLSNRAKRRMLATEGGAFMLADWVHAVFMHFEVNPQILGQQVPFELDLRDGKAYVSLVAFEMNRFRMNTGGRLVEWLCKPISDHGFLNVRTYVRYRDEPGIFFMAEFLPNWLSVLLGGRSFGLPYRYAKLDYQHEADRQAITGHVRLPGAGRAKGADAAGGFRGAERDSGVGHISWHADLPQAPSAEFSAQCTPCEAGSIEEFLCERYTAFTKWRDVHRLFRVWHEPWPKVPIDLEFGDLSLLQSTGGWIDHAEFIGAEYSPGVFDVWMGKPQCVNGKFCNSLWDEKSGRVIS